MWSTLSQNLDRVFAVFYIKDKLDKYLKLKNIKLQEYIKLINRYKGILNKKTNIINKLNNMKLIKLLLELLKVIIIWSMLKLRWFSKTIIELLLYI